MIAESIWAISATLLAFIHHSRNLPVVVAEGHKYIIALGPGPVRPGAFIVSPGVTPVNPMSGSYPCDFAE